MVRTDSHVMTSPGKHQFWTVNSVGESSGEMSPPSDLASPPKKQVWTVNQELARFGHRYSLEKREQEWEWGGQRGKKEGRGGEENIFQLFQTLSLCQWHGFTGHSLWLFSFREARKDF